MMADHRAHAYAFGGDALERAELARRADLAHILDARPSDAAALERMVYGPQPLTEDTRSIIAEWCE